MFVFSEEFPPDYRKPALNLFGEMEAWRSGDPDHLAFYYPKYSSHHMRTDRRLFWSNTYTHVDMGARFNIAALLSDYMGDLLFGSEPKLYVEDQPDLTKALQLFLDEEAVWAKFREAAAVASLYGGVYMCVEWDTAMQAVALAAIPPDNVLPHFWHDKLVSATIFAELPRMGEDMGCYRHFQQHMMSDTGPVIVHSLWVGTKDKLGSSVPLTDHPATAMIVGDPVVLMTDGTVAAQGGGEPTGVSVPVPSDRILLTYIPNKKPSCLAPEGESDFYPIRSALYRLDQVASSWARDIRLGKARVAYSSMLGGKKDHVDRFEYEQEIFYMVPGMTGSRDDPLPLKQMKFDIRSEEHRQALVSVLEEIAAGVGVSPMQAGVKMESPAETGIALKRRMNRTIETQMTKRRYWERPVCKVLEDLLVVRNAIGVRDIPAVTPVLVWGPSIEPAPEETAQTVFSLSQAGAVSTETKVRLVWPDWSEEKVQEEVERIKGEGATMDTENPTNLNIEEEADNDMGDEDEGQPDSG